MKTTFSFFLLESRRLLNIKTIALMVLISALSLYFVQSGIKNYLGIIQSKKDNWDIEQIKVSQYPSYGQYGTYGVQVLFVPSPLHIFFINSSTISQLTANIDSGERLHIYNSLKGRELFREKSGGFKDYSGIFLLLTSLFMFYVGYEAFTHKEYLGFMTNFVRPGSLYFSIVISRILIFGIWILTTALISLLLLATNGIDINGNDARNLLIFLSVLGMVMLFFLLLGMISGSFKSSFYGFVMIIILWFGSVFLIPGVVRTVITQNAENINLISSMDIEKLKILMKVEDIMVKRFGPAQQLGTQVDKRRLVGERMLASWEKEFQRFYSLEKHIELQMEETLHVYEKMSAWFPTTFYLSCANEISSCGFENYLEFFSYLQELKKQFTLYYIKNRFLSQAPEGKGKIKSFFQEGKNFFQAKSRLPWRFGRGVVISLGYIVVLLAVSYFRFKRSLLQT